MRRPWCIIGKTDYKALEEKEAVAKEVNDREAATAVIASALENYINTFCK